MERADPSKKSLVSRRTYDQKVLRLLVRHPVCGTRTATTRDNGTHSMQHVLPVVYKEGERGML